FHNNEVGDGPDHADDLGTVLTDHRVTDALETEGAKRVLLVLLAAHSGLRLGDLEFGHQLATSLRARSIAAGATSSTGSPRRSATASGSSSCLSASTVACTTLIAFAEPRDLDSTSCTPALSRTARAEPPAIT